jgi:SAM-dependent methyltransferase
LKIPEERPSVVREIGSFLSTLATAFDESVKRRTVALAELASAHDVLVIDFDDELLGYVLKAAPEGVIAATGDAKQIAKAQRSRAERLADGRLDLVESAAGELPFGSARFDRVLVAERFEHWPDPRAVFGQIRRVLRPTAKLVLARRVLDRGTLKREAAKLNDVARAENSSVRLLSLLRETGFKQVEQIEERYVIAVRPYDL